MSQLSFRSSDAVSSAACVQFHLLILHSDDILMIGKNERHKPVISDTHIYSLCHHTFSLWPSLLSLCFVIGAQMAVTACWCPACHRRPSEVPRSSPAAMQQALLNSSGETVSFKILFRCPLLKFIESSYQIRPARTWWTLTLACTLFDPGM